MAEPTKAPPQRQQPQRKELTPKQEKQQAVNNQIKTLEKVKQSVPITGEFQALEVVRTRIREIREFIARGLLEKGVDYGTIPGVDKNMLFAAGCEMLNLNYGIIVKPPIIDDKGSDFEKGIFRFRILVEGYTYIKDENGKVKEPPELIYIGSGTGSCSSMESKYKYRWHYSYKLPDSVRAQGINPATSKFDAEQLKNVWIQKYGESSFRFHGGYPQWRLENTDPWDLENTILKQGITRATRALTLNVTGARRIFVNQEELQELGLSELDDTDFVNGEFREVDEQTGEIKGAAPAPAPVVEKKAATPKTTAPKTTVAPPPEEPPPEDLPFEPPPTAPPKKICPLAEHTGAEFKIYIDANGKEVWAHKTGTNPQTGKTQWCTEANALIRAEERKKAAISSNKKAEQPDDMDSVEVKSFTEFKRVLDEVLKKLEWKMDVLERYLTNNYPTSGTKLEALTVPVRKSLLKDLNALYRARQIPLQE